MKDAPVTEIHGSGLAFPLQVDHRGDIALAHGEDDIAQAIRLILSTTPGERLMRPEFGCDLHDLVFDAIDAAMIGRMDLAIRSALDRWEPRIEVEAIDFDLSKAAYGQLLVTITYRVRTTNDRRNLVYPFYVIPDDEEAAPA
jgi:Bacteriophage baseplate protein W